MKKHLKNLWLISWTALQILCYSPTDAVGQAIPISGLPNGGLMQQTDIVPMVRGGVTMKAQPYIWPTTKSLMISNGTSAPAGLAPVNGQCVIGNAGSWTTAACGTPFSIPLAPAFGGTGTTSIFTTGSIPFAASLGIYNQDNPNFFWDSTHHRLGIGTASPAVAIDASYKSDAVALPVGTTGQRPSAIPGMLRMNSSTTYLEAYANGIWNAIYNNTIDPVTCCGADPSGTIDSTAALNAWQALLAAGDKSGYCNGTFKHTNMNWDFAGRANGVTIGGDNADSCTFECTETSNSCLKIYRSGGTSPSDIVSWVNLNLHDLTFEAATSGVAYRISQDNGGDVLESSTISNVNFVNSNPSNNTGAVTLRLNSLNDPVFTNVKVNGNPATLSSPGYGDALQITQVTNDTWNSPSISNANTAIRYTNLGNTGVLGFSHGGVWNALDAENVSNVVIGDSGPYSDETFHGGHDDNIVAANGGYDVTSKAGFYAANQPAFHLINYFGNDASGPPTINPSHTNGVAVTSGNYVNGVVTDGNITMTSNTSQSISGTVAGGGWPVISQRAAGGTIASPTAVGSSAVLSQFSAFGYDGATYTTAGYTLFKSNGTVSSGVVPGAYYVHTYDASGVDRLAMTLDSSQNATFPNTVNATTFVGALTGNASTATKWATGRTISITGDIAYTSPSLDGSGNVTAAGTVSKVNGVAYGTSPSTNTVPVVTGTNAVTYEAVPNAALANSATTVNGQTCTLGSTCTVTAAATGITVGTTTVSGGTNGDIEYNNSGVLGEKGVTGSGSVVLATSPSVSAMTVTGSLTATGLVTNADLANPSTTVNGQTCTLGSTCTTTAAAGTLTGTTLASNVVTGSLSSILDTNGNNELLFGTTASAADYFKITNSTAGGAPLFQVLGSTNAGAIYTTAGNGIHTFRSPTGTSVMTLTPNSGSNSFGITLAIPTITGNHTVNFTDVAGNIVTTGDSGTVSNTMLANPATTVNGQTCTLGSSCTVTATSSGTLTFGTHLTSGGSSYNGSTGVTITPDATSANTASTIVARDGSGNFTAGTITANLTGTASAAPLSGITGFGTGIATALGTNVGSAGAPVINGGALGTPSSGTVTNLTGTAAINITGTAPAGTLTGATLAAGVTGSSITSLGAQAQALNMNTQLINNVVDPVSAQDAATKNYVDSALTDTDIKAATRAAAQGNLAFMRSGNTYTASGLGVLLKATIDSGWSTGAALSVGDRILLPNQTSNVDNGIVTITNLGTIGTNAVLTRSTDMNASAQVTSEMEVPVAEGTNANISYKLSSSGPFTLNTTALPFTMAGGPPTGAAGGNLTGTYPNPSIGAAQVTNAMLAGSIDLTSKVTGILPVANGGTGISSFGTGIATALGINVGSAGAPVTFNGALGTPSSGTLTNATGLPLTTGVTGQLPIANGGTNGTTAQAATGNLQSIFVPTGGVSGTKSNHTGDTNLTALATISIPANSMGANGCMKLHFVGSATGTNSKSWFVTFGGSSSVTQISATTQLSVDNGAILACNQGVTNSQKWPASGQVNWSTNAGAPVTTAIDTTSAQNLVINGQLTNTGENIAVDEFLVEIINRP